MNPYLQLTLVFLTSWFVASLIVLFSLFRAVRIQNETIEAMRDARERDQAKADRAWIIGTVPANRINFN